MAAVPLKDLTALMGAMDPKELRAVYAKAQRAAWGEWSATALPARFSVRTHPNGLGFSQRSSAYMGRLARASAAARVRAQARNATAYNANEGKPKGDLPDYVYTGGGRREVERRKARVSYGGDDVTSKRSIHMRALNVLSNKYGWQTQREVQERKQVTRAAHTRTVNGRSVQVSSYRQMATVYRYTGTPSTQSYAQEWSWKPEELSAVQSSADRNLREMLASIGFKNGKMRLKYRRQIDRQAQESA
jgi:hypothetical protein